MRRVMQSGSGTPWVLTLAPLAAWTALNAVGLWNNWAEDLAAVYVAGWFWDHGQPDLIYAAPKQFFGGQAESWAPLVKSLGGQGVGAFPFVYPPLWAVVAAPLTGILSATAFFNVMLVLQTALLGYGLVVAHRLVRPALPLWKWLVVGCALFQVSVPFVTAMKQCQPSITVAVLTLLAVERSVNGAPRRAGAYLALAAAIKLTPALFVLIFLQRRDWTALRWFAAAGLALGLCSLALAGLQPHVDFLHSLSLASSATLVSSINVSARSMVDYAFVLMGSEPVREAERFYIFSLPQGVRLVSTVVNIVAFAAIFVWFQQKARALPPLAATVVCTFFISVGVPLFGPLGWQHYYLLPALLFPCLSVIATPRQLFVVALPVLAAENVGSFAYMLDANWSPPLYVSLAVSSWLIAVFLVGKRIGPSYS